LTRVPACGILNVVQFERCSKVTRARARTRQPRKPPSPKTRWGDRDGRRRDILAAARTLLARGGYERLAIRDVARGARVSAGTVYTYFASREALFAALYAERLEAFHAEIAPLCARADTPEELFVSVGERYLDVYRVFGREVNLWAMLADAGRQPVELAQPMMQAAGKIMAAVGDALARLGGGARLGGLAERELALPFLWATLNGLADHFTGQRHRMHGIGWSELAGFAARTLVHGLTHAPARAPARKRSRKKEPRP
jgi:AcrR family transcriptional regulator